MNPVLFHAPREQERDVLIAIDLDASKATAAFVSKDGTILERKFFSNNFQDSLSNRSVACVEEILKLCSKNEFKPIAIGVSTKGNVTNGSVKVNRNDRTSTDLKGVLERRFKLQTEVLNRFHAAALGVSQVLKKGQDTSLAVINVSNGVGHGVVKSGKVHEIYDANKGVGGLRVIERWSDGRRLSVAAIAGSSGLKSHARELLDRSYSIKEIFALARREKDAEDVLNDAADAVAELVYDLDRTFRPDKIVSLIYDEENLHQHDKLDFIKNIEQRASRKLRFNVRIDCVEISEVDAKLIGSAKLAMQRLQNSMSASLFVVTGEPTSGKTTFVGKTLVKKLKDMGLKVGGITCQETRNSGQRTGFSMTLLSPQKEDQIVELARVGKVNGANWRPFARFSVNIKNIEEYAVSTLKNAKDTADVIIIHEIASMQLLSNQFLKTVEDILLVNKPIIVTVPIHSSKNEIVNRIKESAKQNGLLFSLSARERQKSQDHAFHVMIPVLTKQTESLRASLAVEKSEIQGSDEQPNNKRKRSEDLVGVDFPKIKRQRMEINK